MQLRKQKVLIGIGAIIVMALLVTFFSSKSQAQFNRVGNQASVQLNYVMLDPEGATNWQGVQITNVIPVGVQTKVFDQPIRMNLDVNGAYTKNGDYNSLFGSYGVGTTFWINQNFDKADWAIAPYIRTGVAGNSGNSVSTTNSYWSYQLEPGLVAKVGNFYGLVAYNYSDGFKKDGYLQEAIAFGGGITLTKSFSVEGRYDLGYGDYDTNKLSLGVVYKF